MPSEKLKNNGTVWERMPVEAAKEFLQGKGYGKLHPSRLAVRDWIAKKYEAQTKPTLLDVPTGSGVDFDVLNPFVKYTGADRTPSLVEAFKLNHPKADIHCEDIRSMSFKDKSFDIVYARAIFEHLPDIEDVELAMRECARVAKKHCIFSFFIPLLETEHLDWNGSYFNNQYAKKDIVKIIEKLGGTFECEHINVTGTEHVDDYDIFYVTLP